MRKKWFFGSIVYTFRGDDYRAERYKAIVEQLKLGVYTDRNNKKISYFSTALDFKPTVCKKVEEIKNSYLVKIYDNPACETYKKDKIIFEELTNFNKNIGFEPPIGISRDIQNKNDNDISIWHEFVRVNPEYLSITKENQNIIGVNINNRSVQELQKDALEKLDLPDGTPLFNDNTLNEIVGERIKLKQEEQQNKAGYVILRALQKLDQKVRKQKPDEFGNRRLTYENKERTEKKIFVFSKNFVGHDLPEDNLNRGPRGTYKQVIGINKNNVLFEHSEDVVAEYNQAFTSAEIEKILIDNKIKSYKGTTKIAENQSIAHNAGAYNLWHAISKKKENFSVGDFKHILSDTKKLHKKGYFHLDIKPENIQVGRNKKLTVIDLDSFASVSDVPQIFGTINYNTITLLRKVSPELGCTPTKKQLQTHDEYALALTILESCGNVPISLMNKNNRCFRRGGLTVSPIITAFIRNQIKRDHHKTFIDLITNPSDYSETENNIYLADMFIEVAN